MQTRLHPDAFGPCLPGERMVHGARYRFDMGAANEWAAERAVRNCADPRTLTDEALKAVAYPAMNIYARRLYIRDAALIAKAAAILREEAGTASAVAVFGNAPRDRSMVRKAA